MEVIVNPGAEGTDLAFEAMFLVWVARKPQVYSKYTKMGDNEEEEN